MKRIAIGGIQHETNTFAKELAYYKDFAQADFWPPLCVSEEILGHFHQSNIPISGFIDDAVKHQFNLEPTLWCAAPPSGCVDHAAFIKITDELCRRIEQLGEIDGLYLDLHGAMVTTESQDAEGDLLARIRAIVGKSVPVVVSLDLHANVSEQMFAKATVLTAFRTYPHTDMHETGQRAAKLMAMCLQQPELMQAKTKKTLPFVISLPWQCTLIEPAKTFYQLLEDYEKSGEYSLSFAQGFPLADVKEMGANLWVYGAKQENVDTLLDEFYQQVIAKKNAFNGKLWSIEEAMAFVLENIPHCSKPLILADTQDNPGGGASSDVVEILKALVRFKVPNSIVATVKDAEAASLAHAAGEGKEVELHLGGKSNLEGQSPYRANFYVKKLGTGQFTGTGAFYKNCPIDLGPMALLEINGVQVVVSSKKMQAADQAIFRHLGVEPASKSVLCLKSSVHFRADFQEMAEEILLVEGPGSNTASLKTLNYQNWAEPKEA